MNEKHSSFIHNLQIATPCPANWDEMDGDERKRFCGQCKLHVYNISAMTLAEAETLVSESEGRLCLRLFRRKDGTVITQDCPVGIAAKFRHQMRRTCGYIIAAVTVSGALMAAIVTGRPHTVTNCAELKEKIKTTAAENHKRAEVLGQRMSPGYEMGDSVDPVRKR